ncbi:MAG: hypothetical protein ABIH00_03095 [Armatimonadota bacterium]
MASKIEAFIQALKEPVIKPKVYDQTKLLGELRNSLASTICTIKTLYPHETGKSISEMTVKEGETYFKRVLKNDKSIGGRFIKDVFYFYRSMELEVMAEGFIKALCHCVSKSANVTGSAEVLSKSVMNLAPDDQIQHYCRIIEKAEIKAARNATRREGALTKLREFFKGGKLKIKKPSGIKFKLPKW